MAASRRVERRAHKFYPINQNSIRILEQSWGDGEQIPSDRLMIWHQPLSRRVPSYVLFPVPLAGLAYSPHTYPKGPCNCYLSIRIQAGTL